MTPFIATSKLTLARLEAFGTMAEELVSGSIRAQLMDPAVAVLELAGVIRLFGQVDRVPDHLLVELVESVKPELTPALGTLEPWPALATGSARLQELVQGELGRAEP